MTTTGSATGAGLPSRRMSASPASRPSIERHATGCWSERPSCATRRRLWRQQGASCRPAAGSRGLRLRGAGAGPLPDPRADVGAVRARQGHAADLQLHVRSRSRGVVPDVHWLPQPAGPGCQDKLPTAWTLTCSGGPATRRYPRRQSTWWWTRSQCPRVSPAAGVMAVASPSGVSQAITPRPVLNPQVT